MMKQAERAGVGSDANVHLCTALQPWLAAAALQSSQLAVRPPHLEGAAAHCVRLVLVHPMALPKPPAVLLPTHSRPHQWCCFGGDRAGRGVGLHSTGSRRPNHTNNAPNPPALPCPAHLEGAAAHCVRLVLVLLVARTKRQLVDEVQGGGHLRYTSTARGSATQQERHVACEASAADGAGGLASRFAAGRQAGRQAGRLAGRQAGWLAGRAAIKAWCFKQARADDETLPTNLNSRRGG